MEGVFEKYYGGQS
ncbi:hypothetical protein Avbf_17767 [Armadillidium vulgare]|nr:hypothetical protein Avbf_17767 [Armadillidium vulgare]